MKTQTAEYKHEIVHVHVHFVPLLNKKSKASVGYRYSQYSAHSYSFDGLAVYILQLITGPAM